MTAFKTRAVILAAAVCICGAAIAQTPSAVRRVRFDSPEGWGLKYFTSAVMFSGLQPPPSAVERRRLGAITIGLESGWVPSLTPERAKQILFTAPYANTFLAVYGPKSANVTSVEQLGSARVAAARGTTQELALSASNPKANIMRTEDDATAAAAYISGQADMLATNSIVAQALAKQNPGKDFDRKFTIRRSPAHMGVQMDQHNLVR